MAHEVGERLRFRRNRNLRAKKAGAWKSRYSDVYLTWSTESQLVCDDSTSPSVPLAGRGSIACWSELTAPSVFLTRRREYVCRKELNAPSVSPAKRVIEMCWSWIIRACPSRGGGLDTASWARCWKGEGAV